MKDTQTINAIIDALYDTISGPAGDRDWNRFRSLFFPGAHLIRTSIAPDGTPQALVMTVETFEQDTADFLRRESFYEVETTHHIDHFGNVAHVFSTYEARRERDAVRPFKRGINSIQLFRDGTRWWVVNILWDNEREDNPIPVEYLP